MLKTEEYDTKDIPTQSRRERERALAKALQAQYRQDALNHGNGNEDEARLVLKMQWRNARRDELLAMCDDGGGKGAYLWQHYASRQPNTWAQLSRLKELLVGAKLLSRADVNQVDIEYREAELQPDWREVK